MRSRYSRKLPAGLSENIRGEDWILSWVKESFLWVENILTWKNILMCAGCMTFVFALSLPPQKRTTNFMQFKPISLAAKEHIQRLTLTGKGINCDLSFANIFSWRFLYDTMYAEEDGFIFFRFHTRHHLAYMMPVGNGDLKVAISKIMEDSRRQGHPFLLLGVCGDMRQQVEDLFPNRLTIEYDRDYCDYIYTRESLATLKGKKLQPKRNHANKFHRLYPEAEFRPLTVKEIPDCMAMVEDWYKMHSDLDDIENEHRSLKECFNNYEALGLRGGVLYVHGKVAAFTYGMPINANTFDVCVEKADEAYEGSYAVVNQEFVKSLPEQYEYINREEDMGMEGLRRAKLSYQPAIILQKYIIKELHPMSHMPGLTMRDHVKTLWQLCFNDNPAFIDLYFKYRYKDEINRCIEQNKRIVSALQVIPYPMTWCGGTALTGYISGACTHPEYRNKGLMRSLLTQTHRQMKQDGVLFATLIPAERSLFDFYETFGYATVFNYKKERWEGMTEPASGELTTSIADLKEELSVKTDLYRAIDNMMAERSCTVQHTYEDYRVIVADMLLENNRLVMAKRNGGYVGAAFCIPVDRGVWVEDVLVNSGEDWQVVSAALFAEAQRIFGTDTVFYKVPVTADGESGVKPLGQARVIDALKALTKWIAAHPSFLVEKGRDEWLIEVHGDTAIEENNGYYLLTPQGCTSSKDCPPGRQADEMMDIPALTAFLMQGMHPFMSLMLN